MTDSNWNARAREARRRGPRCPDVETLRHWVERPDAGSGSTDPRRQATDAHVHACTRCDIEAVALRSFFAPVPGGESEPNRAARLEIQDLLERTLASGSRTPAARATPRLSPPGERVGAWELLQRRSWILALQMALVVGVGLVLLVPVWREGRAPVVAPLGPGQGSLRGDVRPHLLAPRGEQSSIPRRFDWEARGEPAQAWIFRLERVDASLIWSKETRTPSVVLPEGVADSLRPGSRYIWRVQAKGQPSSPASASFAIAP